MVSLKIWFSILNKTFYGNKYISGEGICIVDKNKISAIDRDTLGVCFYSGYDKLRGYENVDYRAERED